MTSPIKREHMLFTNMQLSSGFSYAVLFSSWMKHEHGLSKFNVGHKEKKMSDHNKVDLHLTRSQKNKVVKGLWLLDSVNQKIVDIMYVSCNQRKTTLMYWRKLFKINEYNFLKTGFYKVADFLEI